MKRIGEILKSKREELNISLEFISNKTKLSVVQLQAIEEGDMRFFKDDLSYLSYYVRYYANALGIDYNEIRGLLEESINEYTQTVSLSEIEKRQQITENVNQHKRVSTQAKLNSLNKPRNFDWKAFFFMSIAVIICTVLLYVIVDKVIIPGFNQPPTETPVVSVPDIDPEKDKEDEEKTDPDKEKEEETTPESALTLTVDPQDPSKYTITGWTEKEILNIDIKVVNRTWLQITENGAALANPAATIYEKDEIIKLKINAEKGKTFAINFGYFTGNEIYINEKQVVVDESLTQLDVVQFNFVFNGGN